MMSLVGDGLDAYRRHADELIRYATSLVGPDDAPDVVTDAVLRSVRSPRWADVREPRAYLYRAVLNEALAQRRSADRRRAREALAAPPAATESPQPSIDAQRALAGLSPQQRAVVHLTYWEDLTPAAIAALLGVGEGTVRKQLARARDHLRRILDEH